MMKRVNFSPEPINRELDSREAQALDQFNQNADQAIQAVQAAAKDQDDSGDIDPEVLKERVVDALKTIYDPEIPVNIYDLGLIYRVDIKNGFAEIDMTLTAPGCPVAHSFPGLVERSVTLVPGIDSASVELVWEPPWTQDLISEAAQLELGLL